MRSQAPHAKGRESHRELQQAGMVEVCTPQPLPVGAWPPPAPPSLLYPPAAILAQALGSLERSRLNLALYFVSSFP